MDNGVHTIDALKFMQQVSIGAYDEVTHLTHTGSLSLMKLTTLRQMYVLVQKVGPMQGADV
jgi:hypothetical protein